MTIKRYDRITPEGTKDLLFEECTGRRQIMETIRERFEKAGYSEVITPGFEFYDVFSANAMYFPQESMYKAVDPKGRIMAARPDSTIPIARIKATRLKGCSLPVRLFYAQCVYRQNPGLRGHSNEMMQMGVELIGESGFEADLEALELGMDVLSACQGNGYRMELGHVGIFNLLMDCLEGSEEKKRQIHELMISKNYAGLSEKLESFSDGKAVSILKELPRLFGGEEVFEKARKLFAGFDGRLMEMCDYLEKIFNTPWEKGRAKHVIVDFGLVNQADYYTSLAFQGFIPTMGEAVLSGGRYDNLLQNFGEDLPATGFGVNVDLLTADLLRRKERGEQPEQESKCIRIALTKGRLEDKTVQLFEKLGFDCTNIREKGRKLLLTIPDKNIEVVLAKAADVITYVEHGVCDMGVVGLDTIMEYGGTFYEVLDLGFGKCRFALAAPKGTDMYSGYAEKKIASKYPKVTRQFFEEKQMDVQVIKIEGSVELAPLLKLVDGIVDLVETGTTLKENGLEVLEEVRPVSARLIVNEASMKMKKEEIDGLIEAIEKEIKE